MMRKLLMVVTMILVPAIASAWTLPVKVTNSTAGIAGGNKATVTIGATSTDVAVGTKYFYPANTVATVTVDVTNSENVASITLDGVAQAKQATGVTTITVTKGLASLHNLNVVYNTAATAPKVNVNLAQGANGLTSIAIGKASTTAGFTGVAVGTSVSVTARPNVGFKLVSITVNGVADTTGAGSTTAVTKVFTTTAAPSPNTVTAAFEVAPAISTTLSVPASGVTGSAVACTAVAFANVTPLTYAWTVDGVAQASTTSAMTFTPSSTGTKVVQVTVSGGGISDVKSASVVVADGVAAANSTCTGCHNNSTPTIVENYNASVHGGSTHSACSACHNTSAHTSNVNATNIDPATFQVLSSTATANLYGERPVAKGNVFCTACHTGTYAIPHAAPLTASGKSCNQCHTATGTGDAHQITVKANSSEDCLACHTDAASGSLNADINNDGVRAIAAEFGKRSHHITSASPASKQCRVCHLEGTGDYHFNGQIDLRNADTDAAFVWTGTEHTAMDNFCFSCHDDNGATSAGIAAIMTGQNFGGAFSATNPFADTLTNSYDQVARAGVVDVKTAFQTTNASHHAVSGQRYAYRFSNRTNADAWAARNGKTAPADSELAQTHVGEASPNGGVIADFSGHYDPAGAHEGGEATLFEADKFVASYIPLGATQNVADNSTLHCGDCHTVGQWAVGTSTNADGSATTAVIGAHGSANEYMLRNSLGTDALHSGQTYVCFNCHKGGQLAPYDGAELVAATDAVWDELVAEGFIASTRVKPTWRAGWNALHPNVFAGQQSGYATAHAVSAFHVQCQADSAAQIGVTSRLAVNVSGNMDRTLDYQPAPGATAVFPISGGASGNITGIACTNCHNSGLRSGWGGIHGGNNTYTDGLNRAQTTYRFMPGMGNYRYAPPGGWDGKDVSDTTLVTQATSGVGAGKPMGGCYTNSALTGADPNTGWGSCDHHGTSTARTTAGGQAAGFRTSYGGGTTATPTAVEPTVREATAGNSLVTRPLKY